MHACMKQKLVRHVGGTASGVAQTVLIKSVISPPSSSWDTRPRS